jgi:hypothetical protein
MTYIMLIHIFLQTPYVLIGFDIRVLRNSLKSTVFLMMIMMVVVAAAAAVAVAVVVVM